VVFFSVAIAISYVICSTRHLLKTVKPLKKLSTGENSRNTKQPRLHHLTILPGFYLPLVKYSGIMIPGV
jgi:hypothetical protein